MRTACSRSGAAHGRPQRQARLQRLIAPCLPEGHAARKHAWVCCKGVLTAGGPLARWQHGRAHAWPAQLRWQAAGAPSALAPLHAGVPGPCGASDMGPAPCKRAWPVRGQRHGPRSRCSRARTHTERTCPATRRARHAVAGLPMRPQGAGRRRRRRARRAGRRLPRLRRQHGRVCRAGAGPRRVRRRRMRAAGRRARARARAALPLPRRGVRRRRVRRLVPTCCLASKALEQRGSALDRSFSGNCPARLALPGSGARL